MITVAIALKQQPTSQTLTILHIQDIQVLITVRFKNFRDDEFQKPRKFLANIESFQTGVKNVDFKNLESF